MNEDTVLIIGIHNIAKALGVDARTLKKTFLPIGSFPAGKLEVSGQWVTTRKKLTDWADTYVGDLARRDYPAKNAS